MILLNCGVKHHAFSSLCETVLRLLVCCMELTVVCFVPIIFDVITTLLFAVYERFRLLMLLTLIVLVDHFLLHVTSLCVVR